MDSIRPNNPKNVLTLKEAAQKLAVSVDTLLTWNQYNILKPTITPSGAIGYFQEQIDQFLEIQKLSKVNIQTVNPNPLLQQNNFPEPIKNDQPFVNLKNETNSNFSQINNYNFYSQPPTPPDEKNKSAFSSYGIIATFLIFIIAVSAILFSQQNKLDTILHQNQISYNNGYVSNPNQSSHLNDSVNNTYSVNIDKVDSGSRNGFATLNEAFGNKNNTDSKSKDSQDQKAILASVAEKNAQTGVNPARDTTTYSQTSNFATSSSCPTCSKNSDTENTVFDANGNIKVSKTDSLGNRLLATTLGVAGITQNQSSSKQSSNSVTVLGFLVLTMIAFYIIYSARKQFNLSPIKADDFGLQPVNFPQEIESKKILEIGQKADGTVVIYLQGNEYKVSKPELDSESDKFIERLMQIVSPGIKEIEYDSLQDDKLSLSAPLSKIVTRLGFVGIKRDLFFPRTSKTRVVFRKYITEDDLLSMNLTIDQISSGFITNY